MTSKTPRKDDDPAAVGATPVAGFGAIEGDADAPMTEKQAVELRDLAERAGEAFDGNLTRGQAEERIAHLRERLR